MSLRPRRPPGNAKRKALAFTAEIVSLRGAGHSLSAIREALEDAGVLVSISTVRREVLKGASATAVCRPSVVTPAPTVATGPRESRGPRDAPSRPAEGAHSAPPGASLPGRAIAEEFMRGRPTNTLLLEEHSK